MINTSCGHALLIVVSCFRAAWWWRTPSCCHRCLYPSGASSHKNLPRPLQPHVRFRTESFAEHNWYICWRSQWADGANVTAMWQIDKLGTRIPRTLCPIGAGCFPSKDQQDVGLTFGHRARLVYPGSGKANQILIAKSGLIWLRHQWESQYRESRGGGRFTFSTTGNLVSNFELIGLAHARIEVRAFNVVMMPAFATEIVCCSWETSWCHQGWGWKPEIYMLHIP